MHFRPPPLKTDTVIIIKCQPQCIPDARCRQIHFVIIKKRCVIEMGQNKDYTNTIFQAKANKDGDIFIIFFFTKTHSCIFAMLIQNKRNISIYFILQFYRGWSNNSLINTLNSTNHDAEQSLSQSRPVMHWDQLYSNNIRKISCYFQLFPGRDQLAL